MVNNDRTEKKVSKRTVPIDTAEQVIEALGLVPLSEEGGLVLETYRSTATTAEGDAAGTAIFYLLRGSSFSHLHRLRGDELYHFYLGDPVELVELKPDGSMEKTILGNDILHGEQLQHLVPDGTWQGSHLAEGGSWALMGTTMCPGYRAEEYEHGDAETLLRMYPSAEEEIRKLTGDVKY